MKNTHPPPIEDDPSLQDPFRLILAHKMYYVDSVAGSYKTYLCCEHMIKGTRLGDNYIIAVPTVKLAESIKNNVIPAIEAKLGFKALNVTIIHNENTKGSVPNAICEFIGKSEGGHILIVTHEGILRVIGWPKQINKWHLYIDEVFDPLLSTGVLRLRFSHHNLGDTLNNFGLVNKRRLQSVLGDDEAKNEYYHITPILRYDDPEGNIWSKVDLHMYGKPYDQVYEGFGDTAEWLRQQESLFTHAGNWDNMKGMKNNKTTLPKGAITISGFRRPDRFLGFRRVTIMSALFKSTMLCNLWSRLGIEFKPSPNIKLSQQTTPLGSRRLRIGYLIENPWSKSLRKKSDGIGTVLDIIAKSGVIDRSHRGANKSGVAIVINIDDRDDPDVQVHIESLFTRHKVLPHNLRGSNEWTNFNQLIYVASLNSTATDIEWVERAIGISAIEQRVARVAHEIYQTLMRLSIRLPQGKDDITVVVMEKMIADWLAQYFRPQRQVEIIQIDTGGRIPKPGKGGRPKSDRPLKERNSESVNKYRERKRAEKQNNS
jgi:hypothetical protein